MVAQGKYLSNNNPSQGLYVSVQKGFCWAYFRESLFSEGRNIGGNFLFQKQLTLTVHIRKGLLSEVYLRLRFGGGAYFREGYISEFYGITYPHVALDEFYL